MEIFHFVQDINLSSGGFRSAILGISENNQNKKYHSQVYTIKYEFQKSLFKERDSKLIKSTSRINLFFSIFKLFLFKKSKFFIKILHSKEPIIHIHGMWLYIPIIGYLIAKFLDIPYVFSPHGMVMPFALNYHSKRKKLALFLYQKRIVEDAKLVITNSEYELNSIKANFHNKNIVLIPNGITLNKENVINKKFSKEKRTRICFFLGRIAPPKFEELIKA